jgi:hypothetical protein
VWFKYALKRRHSVRHPFIYCRPFLRIAIAAQMGRRHYATTITFLQKLPIYFVTQCPLDFLLLGEELVKNLFVLLRSSGSPSYPQFNSSLVLSNNVVEINSRNTGRPRYPTSLRWGPVRM